MATAKLTIKGYDELKTPLKQAENELQGFESVAKKVGDTLKTAFTVAAIVESIKKITQAVAECVDAFKDQIEVETRLDAVIRATDQQYKYTTRDIKEYASALQQQTRFADDVIESSASLLVATQKFSKEGLERTLSLSADLAEAMGTDLTSATSTLSKALIEPGEGLNRLRTIGITFTDAEEEMIKQLRDAGKEFEAQQVILDKVEKAYGGVAKSVGSIDTSTLDKISHVWGDLKEDLGNIFTNTLGPVFKWIYDTLSWLQRLTNQVAEKSELKKYMTAGDATSMANNFTTEYLTEQLNKTFKDYRESVKLLMDDYSDVFLKIDERFHMNVEQFLEQSQEDQWKLLKEVLGEEDIRSFYITQIADSTYETVMLTKALEIQQQQAAEAAERFNYEQLNAAAKQSAAVVEAIGGIGEVFNNAKMALFNDATVDGLTGNVLSTITRGYLGSGISDSPYMSIMLGELGLWTQTTQAYMLAMYDWGDDLDELVQNLMMSPLFMSPTLSTLGAEGLKNLDFSDHIGTNELQVIIDTYAAKSKTYQQDLLQQQIDYLSEALESAMSLLGDDSPIVQYLSEILGNTEKQLKELKKSATSGSGSGKGGLGNVGSAIEDFIDGAAAVFEDFKDQAGEAGEFINRLTSNMAKFTPIIGLIVTALHYVIQGLIEELGSLLNEFVTWGLEPLREIGRMIGEILTPVFQEIMPSVIASGKALMNLFGAIARVLTPIVTVLMKIIGPILTVLADILVSIVGTISWAIDWIAYCITWVLNKVTFGWVGQTAKPGSLSDYVSGMMATPGEGYESVSTTTGTNAAYSGMTNIYLNVYQQGTVVGEDGITEFALIIRNELADLAYYSR